MCHHQWRLAKKTYWFVSWQLYTNTHNCHIAEDIMLTEYYTKNLITYKVMKTCLIPYLDSLNEQIECTCRYVVYWFYIIVMQYVGHIKVYF